MLIIDPDGRLVPPLPGRAEPDAHFAFVLISQHATDKFDVRINFDDIVIKHDKHRKDNPFSHGGHTNRQLVPGEIDIIKQKMKPASEFEPEGSLPYTTYKYTVVVKNLTTGETDDQYDPTSTCRRRVRAFSFVGAARFTPGSSRGPKAEGHEGFGIRSFVVFVGLRDLRDTRM
jgi:hypothetical protein